MSAEIGDLEQYVLKILQPERRETNGTGSFVEKVSHSAINDL